ncbi:MAG: AMP-binding protein [Planctomycetota bacterium]|nr:AMP-binding protein [Planctomycetota bacterium]
MIGFEKRSITEVVEETARRVPRKTAIIYERERITYSELIRRKQEITSFLHSLGVRNGDRIAFLLSNRPEYATFSLAAFSLGAQVVPLNTRLASDEILFILTDSSSRIFVTEQMFIEVAASAIKRGTSIEHLINVDKMGFADSKPIEESEQVSPDSIALIAYTSGTTGLLKGAQLSHKNLLSNAFACLETIELHPKDNFLCILPLSHTFPFTVCLLVPLLSGTTVTLIPSVKHFKQVMKSVFKNRVTIFVGIPQIYRAMANAPAPGIVARFFLRFLNPLRLCISGADPLPTDILDAFERRFKIPLLEGYGLTEASPVVTFNLPRNRKKGSVGIPLKGVEVRVLSEETGALSHCGEGELCVKGDNVMAGYLNRPFETSKCIVDGWLRTGDIARIDEEGFVHIIGRKKDMISVKGLKIYPPEVEMVLMNHPAVADCAVFGIPDEQSGEVPAAAVILKENFQTTPNSLKSFLKEHIADYKIPRKILFLEELPKTATGKVRRHILSSLYRQK